MSGKSFISAAVLTHLWQVSVSIAAASGRLRAGSGGVGVASGSRKCREVTVRAGDGSVARLSFGGLIKVDAAGWRLFPLVGGGQSIGDDRLGWELRDSVVGGPSRYVTDLVFAPTPSPLVIICWITPPLILSLQQFGSYWVRLKKKSKSELKWRWENPPVNLSETDVWIQSSQLHQQLVGQAVRKTVRQEHKYQSARQN